MLGARQITLRLSISHDMSCPNRVALLTRLQLQHHVKVSVNAWECIACLFLESRSLAIDTYTLVQIDNCNMFVQTYSAFGSSDQTSVSCDFQAVCGAVKVKGLEYGQVHSLQDQEAAANRQEAAS